MWQAQVDLPFASELADHNCPSLDTTAPNCQHCAAWEVPNLQKGPEEKDFAAAGMVLLHVSKKRVAGMTLLQGINCPGTSKLPSAGGRSSVHPEQCSSLSFSQASCPSGITSTTK